MSIHAWTLDDRRVPKRDVHVRVMNPGRFGMFAALHTGRVVRGLAVVAHRVDFATLDDVFTVALLEERKQ